MKNILEITMKVLISLKKHWFKVLSVILIFVISLYVVTFAIKKTMNYGFINNEEKQQTVYTIWHVETFEGGSKARINYLKSIARDMEKQDNTTLFMIKSVSPNSLESALENSLPDIISFGFGVGDIVLPHLSPQNSTFNVRDELISSGSFNQKFYAVPYIIGGYALFYHSIEASRFYAGSNNYIKPNNIYSSLEKTPEEHDQFDAYKKFIYDKNSKLLGSTRDLFRVNNLNNIGRTNAIITPVDSYTDLVQYMGIINMDQNTRKFLTLALDDRYQNSLADYSLFSSKYNKIYSSGIYNDMENAILNCYVPNVFNEKI